MDRESPRAVVPRRMLRTCTPACPPAGCTRRTCRGTSARRAPRPRRRHREWLCGSSRAVDCVDLFRQYVELRGGDDVVRRVVADQRKDAEEIVRFHLPRVDPVLHRGKLRGEGRLLLRSHVARALLEQLLLQTAEEPVNETRSAAAVH